MLGHAARPVGGGEEVAALHEAAYRLQAVAVGAVMDRCLLAHEPHPVGRYAARDPYVEGSRAARVPAGLLHVYRGEHVPGGAQGEDVPGSEADVPEDDAVAVHDGCLVVLQGLHGEGSRTGGVDGKVVALTVGKGLYLAQPAGSDRDVDRCAVHARGGGLPLPSEPLSGGLAHDE